MGSHYFPQKQMGTSGILWSFILPKQKKYLEKIYFCLSKISPFSMSHRHQCRESNFILKILKSLLEEHWIMLLLIRLLNSSSISPEGINTIT